jgi:hypothetical protein
LTEDYPVVAHTKKDGTKVKKHTRGELRIKIEIKNKREQNIVDGINDTIQKIPIDLRPNKIKLYHKLSDSPMIDDPETDKYAGKYDIWFKNVLLSSSKLFDKDSAIWTLGHEIGHHIWNDFITKDAKLKDKFKAYYEREKNNTKFRNDNVSEFFGDVFSDYLGNIKNTFNLSDLKQYLNELDSTKDLIEYPFILEEHAVIDMYNCVKKQVQIHVDFANDFLETHTDFREDVSGLSKLTDAQLAEVLALEEQIQNVSSQPQSPQIPDWRNHAMTPVASSFVRGAGSYKGKLLLEFHHDPGQIWGFDVNSQGHEFFNELMMAGSKGGWVWDKILGKPSEFGMAKGQFFAYPDDNGVMKFHTSPGAEFVHKFGRPTKFTYNPVGYRQGGEEQYKATALEGKAWKESVVRPSKSREPAEMGLIEGQQRLSNIQEIRAGLQRLKAFEEVKPLIEKKVRLRTFNELQQLFKEKNIKDEENKTKTERDFSLTLVIDTEEPKIPKSRGRGVFNKRSNRAKTMDKKIRAKTVYPEVTEAWLKNPNYSDVEGIDTPGGSGEDKLKFKEILSDLSKIGDKFWDNEQVQNRIEHLMRLLNRFEKSTHPDLVRSLEKQIKNAIKHLEANLEQIKEEGAKQKKESDAKWAKGDIGYLEDGKQFTVYGVRDDGKLVVQHPDYGTWILNEDKALKEKPSKEEIFLNSDINARIGIAEMEKQYKQEIEDNITLFSGAILKSKVRIGDLKAELKSVDPETGMSWKVLPSGSGSEGTHKSHLEKFLRDEKKNLKEWEENLEQNLIIKELDLPAKFNFEDTKLKFSNRSKFSKANKEWLTELRRQYLLLPARFRDVNSPKINIIDKCKTWDGKNSNRNGGTHSSWGSGRIRVASNPKIRSWFQDSVVAHEVGHHMHHDLMRNNPEAWKRFEGIYDKNLSKFVKYGDRALLTQSGLSATEWVKRKAFEFFANIFAEYYTGLVRGGRDTWIKYEVERGKIPATALNEKGYLDTYPEAKEFMEEIYGIRGFTEVR